MKDPFNRSWFESRTQLAPALAHIQKKVVPQHRHALWYTFGGFALFLLGLQLITGVLLMMRYVPSAAPAADAISGKPLCLVRVTDSIVVAVVTDSTLEDYKKGERVVMAWSGAPDAHIPDVLRGKVSIEYTIPKDSTWIGAYVERAVVPDDTSADGLSTPLPVIEERADVPRELRDYVTIVRDSSTGTIIRPSVAYTSVERIMSVVPFGSVLRSLHAYGANLMVACIFLHMFSAFFMQGYRKPRELMWLTGVALFAIVLGFGFTGYLLPWNVLAYYATRVGVGYPESYIPGIGTWIADMMRGGGEVTGETLTRMFTVHVVVLPLSALLLVGIHMTILQVHGVSSPVRVRERGMNIMTAAIGAVSLGMLALYAASVRTIDYASPWVILPLTVLPMVAAFFLGQLLLGSGNDASGKLQPLKFYWNFAMRDYIGWLIGLAVLVFLALRAPWKIAGIAGAPVDLSKPMHTPPGIHPEWYFMWAFQFLRVFPGELAMMAFAAAGAAWFLIPFLDKNAKREEKNKKFMIIGAVIVAVLMALTWFGYRGLD